MIRIVRGPEPKETIDAREEQLSRAALEAGESGPGAIGGYDVARPKLYARQFSKCAYCESWVQEESQPVEHVRPKGRPSRIDWSELLPHRPYALARLDEARFARGLPPTVFDRVRWPDPSTERGYWWLAWTWENLVFGCVSCNGGSRKGSRFPLAHGSPVLGLHEQPPGGEQALLLDPADPRTDPMDVIRFRWDGKHWRPFAIDDDPRAAWTIAVLGLDSPSLLGLYRPKVAGLELMARTFKQAVDGAAEELLRSEWSLLEQTALAPGQSFLALTHDWLAATFAAEIDHYGLALPRPLLRHATAVGDAVAQPPLPVRAELDGLSPPLQSRVRVIRHSQPRSEELHMLLVDLCRERPSTTDELVRLVGRSTVLPDHLRALEGTALVRDALTGHWSPPEAGA